MLVVEYYLMATFNIQYSFNSQHANIQLNVNLLNIMQYFIQ